MKIKLYNNIAKVGLDNFPAEYEVSADAENEDGIVVRSAALHDAAFPESLRGIARAGAGVNNIPIDKCTEKGICVFNTPGANAQAVKELCIAALLMTSRKISDGIEWAKTLADDPDAAKTVEKEKKKFEGPEISGKTLGIIGLGAIGSGLAEAAFALGMKIIGFDPYMRPEAEEKLSKFAKIVKDADELYKESDYISIHVPSLPSTRGMINKEKIALMKDGARLLNLARADLIMADDVIAALESGKLSAYYTDFPTPDVIGKKNVIASPHLGASTPEAEDNCAVMACNQLRDYLEAGNIKNSVNFPNLSMPRNKKFRISAVYDKEAEMKVKELLCGADVVSAERGEIGYLIAESDKEIELWQINAVSGVKRAIAY